MKKLWQKSIPSYFLGCLEVIRVPLCVLLISTLVISANSGFAQQAKLNMNLSNVTLQKVFQQIRKQAGYEVFFSNDDLNVNQKVSVNVSNGTLDDVMKQALGSSYSYNLSGNKIMIELAREKKSSVEQKKQPSRTIKGKVTSESGEPLPGSTIRVVGISKGVSTNGNGEFEIVVPGGYKQLEVTFIGYDSQIIALGANNTVSVKLSESTKKLDEVVVTGYQKVDKRLFSGATTKLSAAEVKLDGMADISRSLEGRVAGVSVQNVSGSFGSAPKIRVRGATSIFGGSKPLWVVDGVVMEDVLDVDADALSSGNAETLISSAIAGLNASDIEDYQILKDGSATSIYGARAMAGVIVVTTKKGRSGQNSISYSGEFTTRLKPSYARFNIMNSQGQMSVYQEMAQKGWLNYADVYNARESGVYGKMYDMITSYDASAGKFGLENTPEAKAAYLRQAEMRNTDWFDALFRMNIMQTHSISMTSGTEKASYYTSVSALHDPGWFKNSSVERYTANVNATYNIFKNLSLNIITNGSYRDQKAPGTLSQETDVVSGEVKRDFDINPYSYALNTSRVLDRNTFYKRNYAPFNIFDELENNYMNLKVADLKFQGEVNWRPFDGLTLTALGAVRYSATSQEHFITDFSNQAQAYRAMPTTVIRDKNPFLYTDPDNPYSLPITVLPEGGIYNRNDYSLLSYDFRTSATFNKVFAEKHTINILAGMETNSTDRHKTWFRGWGLQYSMGEIPFYAYEVFKKGKEEGSDYYSLVNTRSRNVAFFSMATYSYKGKYSVTGTYRYEGTNKLGKSRSARWLPTWNISGRWNVHEEDFFKAMQSNVLSNLSFRASYSLTADRGPSFVTNSLAVIGSTTPWRPTSGVQESGLAISSLENSELTYEKKTELNVGFDAGFLNNKIVFKADAYTRDNYDLIGSVVTEGLGGEVRKYGNVAEMKSKGLELSLVTTNISTGDFKWTTDFVYSHTYNEVSKLESNKRLIDMVTGTGFAAEGYPVRSIFSIPFAGLNDQGLPTFYGPDGKKTVTGIYFQERNNLDFLKYSGSADPTDVGSLGNTFSYKGFTLNAFVTYSFGNVIRLDPVFKSGYSDLSSMPKEFKNRWEVPGDENVTNIPVIASVRQSRNISNLSYAYNAYNYSDVRIADGGFVRLKEVSLLYNFNKELIKRFSLTNLSLKIQATNLFLLYADKKLNGQDPEFFNTGGVAAPIPQQFTLTLRVGL